MTHIIQHTFKPRIFIPMAAIDYNVDLITLREGQGVTSDNVNVSIKNIKEISVLSQEAINLVMELYDMDMWNFLQRWYKTNTPISSMEFLYMELNPVEDES